MIQTTAVFIGGGSLLMQCAEAYLKAGHTVRAVVSANPVIVRWAQTRGVSVFADEASAVRQPEMAFDYLFSIANCCVLPCALMSRAQLLAMRFHDALFPSYAGWNAPTWALMAQERVHGVSWHQVSANPGSLIVRQTAFDIPAGETALSLQARCYEAGLASFRLLLEDIGRGKLHLSEPDRARRYFGRQQRPHALGTLDFSRTARELASLVAALDFGPYPNPVACAKIYLGDRIALVRAARVLENSSRAAPGTVLQIDEERVLVATGDGDILLGGYSDPWGGPDSGLVEGTVLPVPSEPMREQLASRSAEIGAGEQFWSKVYAALAPVELAYRQQPAAPQFSARQRVRVRLMTLARGARLVAGFVAWLSALTARQRISVMYSDSVLKAQARGLECWLSPSVPLTLDTQPQDSAQHAQERAAAAIAHIYLAGPCPRDLPLRLGARSRFAERSCTVAINLNGSAAPDDADLTLTADFVEQRLDLVADEAIFSDETLRLLACHLDGYLNAFEGAPRVAAISLAAEAEAALQAAMNATATPRSLHEAVAAQSAQTPARTAESPLEKSLAAIWEQVLGKPRVAMTDNFFDLGGSFALAMQVQRRLLEACGRSVCLPDMVRFPTLCTLVAHLGESADSPANGAGFAAISTESRGNCENSERTATPREAAPAAAAFSMISPAGCKWSPQGAT
ncbi:MAG: formyltransferase family protein [Polaromonas sp.]